jgi:hypothetical protein
MLFLLIAYSELNRDNDKNRHCTIKSKDFNVIQLFVQVAGLTFFSPIAFACWISTFSINTDVELTFANACYIITSAIIGSILVWLIITVVILKIKQNLQYYWLDRVKYISSAILGVFGAMMIVGI